MSEPNEEFRETEAILGRFRPREPSAELKARVLGAARDTWHRDSAGIPWQIPLRRLAASAAAAVLIASLANLYGDRASARRPERTPIADRAEPCDLEAMIDVQMPIIKYMAIAARPTQGGASALLDHLEMVREALREAEWSETSAEPSPVERRSRLPAVPSSLHS